MGIELSSRQLNALEITERVTAIISLLGILFILSTFLLARGFDKPINRLIFFASFSNFGMCIASLIAEEGPRRGEKSSLCQFQAWTIQMFLGVDVFWALCMALNVYLGLFRKWSAQRIQGLEWRYFVICYGAAFVPAFVYLFVETEKRGKVYGPALVWCWIKSQYDLERFLTLYFIVWAALLLAFGIYVCALAKVWRNRRELSGLFNPFNEDPFATRITTHIEIVHEDAATSPLADPPDYFRNNIFSAASTPSTPSHQHDKTSSPLDHYTVNIESPAPRRPSRPEQLLKVRTMSRDVALRETNADAWLYARAAFLFFCALLISWIPASVNRLYSFIHPDRLVFGLNWAAALTLPLQGFWNCVIYIITSQTAVRNLFRAILGKPHLERKTSYLNESGLDAATGETGAKQMRVSVGNLASLMKGSEKDDTQLQVQESRCLSVRDGRQRLESEASSIIALPSIRAK